MAVVVSASQNEVEDFKKKGLDILTAPQADGEGGLGNEVQGRRRSAPHRLRLCHVDDRLRCAVLFHHLPRQAHEEPHPDADHCTGEPGVPGEEQRPDRGLRGRLPQSAEGAGDLRLRFRRRREAG